MQRSRALVAGAIGLVVGALTVPGIVGANARRTAGNKANDAVAEKTFVASLRGANEVGGGSVIGTGAATITVDVAGGQVCIDSVTTAVASWTTDVGTLSDPITLTHLHRGASGTNGPVVIDFDPQGAAALHKCVAVADATLLGEILADPAGFYVNVHTVGFPAGAVRGNLSAGPTGAGALHLLDQPQRAFDSRLPGLPDTGPLPRVPAGDTFTIDLQSARVGFDFGRLIVPPGATGALVTLTVTDTVGAGFLKLYSGALSAAPETSVINWSSTGQNLATTTTVAVSAEGIVKITVGPQATHIVLDVVGYYF